MNKNILLSTSLLIFSVSAQAGEWELLPVLGDNYQADLAVAAVAGSIDVDGSSASTKGVELSLNCPLLKAPNHNIRQQVSLTKTDKNGVKTDSIELSPHHMFNLNDKLSAGFGPSIGYTKVKANGTSDSVLTYGAGVSARYNINKNLFIGAQARYAKSQDVEITGLDKDFDNTTVTLKLGYQF